MKIYLAGGLRSGWQARVRSSVRRHEFLDPSMHELKEPAEYTAWDLAAIKESDLLLAYMEKGNPAGYSLALEVGYAHGLGKPVFYIQDQLDPLRHRYFEMVREVASRTYRSLDDAIADLQGEMASSEC